MASEQALSLYHRDLCDFLPVIHVDRSFCSNLPLWPMCYRNSWDLMGYSKEDSFPKMILVGIVMAALMGYASCLFIWAIPGFNSKIYGQLRQPWANLINSFSSILSWWLFFFSSLFCWEPLIPSRLLNLTSVNSKTLITIDSKIIQLACSCLACKSTLA